MNIRPAPLQVTQRQASISGIEQVYTNWKNTYKEIISNLKKGQIPQEEIIQQAAQNALKEAAKCKTSYIGEINVVCTIQNDKAKLLEFSKKSD